MSHRGIPELIGNTPILMNDRKSTLESLGEFFAFNAIHSGWDHRRDHLITPLTALGTRAWPHPFQRGSERVEDEEEYSSLSVVFIRKDTMCQIPAPLWGSCSSGYLFGSLHRH